MKLLAGVGIALCAMPLMIYVGVPVVFGIEQWKQEAAHSERVAERQYAAALPAVESVKLVEPAESPWAVDAPAEVTVSISWYDDQARDADQERTLRIEATDYAERECRALLRTLAENCELIEITGASRGNLSFILHIAQRAEGGLPAGRKSGRTDTLQVAYVGRAGDARAMLDRLYSQLASDCQRKLGVCELEKLSVRASFFPRSSAKSAARATAVIRVPRMSRGAL